MNLVEECPEWLVAAILKYAESGYEGFGSAIGGALGAGVVGLVSYCALRFSRFLVRRRRRGKARSCLIVSMERLYGLFRNVGPDQILSDEFDKMEDLLGYLQADDELFTKYLSYRRLFDRWSSQFYGGTEAKVWMNDHEGLRTLIGDVRGGV